MNTHDRYEFVAAVMTAVVIAAVVTAAAWWNHSDTAKRYRMIADRPGFPLTHPAIGDGTYDPAGESRRACISTDDGQTWSVIEYTVPLHLPSGSVVHLNGPVLQLQAGQPCWCPGSYPFGCDAMNGGKPCPQ